MKIFDYGDIQLISNKYIIESRSEYDTAIQFGPRKFKLPIVSANMQTVINEELAKWLAKSDYFYIIHRFDEETRIPFIKHIRNSGLFASISVDVKKAEFDFIEKLAQEKLIPEHITIDIAHSHSDLVVDMIKHIKTYVPDSFVIADNIGTPEGVRELENVGADATEVGIGPDRVCITRVKTGFGADGWQLAALNICNRTARRPLIAGDDIRTHDDIAKSTKFDASIVVIGSLFAAHEESPGETVELSGKQYKEYFGSAPEFRKGERKNVEGKRVFVEHKSSLMDILKGMQQDSRSSISYAGGKDLKSLRTVDYVIVRDSIFSGDGD